MITLSTLAMIGEFVIRLFIKAQIKPAFIIRKLYLRGDVTNAIQDADRA